MKNNNLLTKISVLLYIVLLGIDRVIFNLPNHIYFPFKFILIVLMILGIIKNKKIK